MGNRALSTKASQVAALGAELIKGILAQNSMACAKHFPGHGDTLADSHHTLPVLLHHLDFLEKRELIPFAAAIAAGVPMVMIAHLLFPHVDESNPTSFSLLFLQSILRKKMGFTGICIVDDLNMDAVAQDFPLEEMVRLGNPLWDLFLFCENEHRQRSTFELLTKEVELTGAEAHDASVSRIQKTAQKFCASPRFALADLPRRLDESEKFIAKEFPHLKE
jgi:beta-N-acetylhexosaminidase